MFYWRLGPNFHFFFIFWTDIWCWAKWGRLRAAIDLFIYVWGVVKGSNVSGSNFEAGIVRRVAGTFFFLGARRSL